MWVFFLHGFTLFLTYLSYLLVVCSMRLSQQLKTLFVYTILALMMMGGQQVGWEAMEAKAIYSIYLKEFGELLSIKIMHMARSY